jgi:hypothetical protein
VEHQLSNPGLSNESFPEFQYWMWRLKVKNKKVTFKEIRKASMLKDFSINATEKHTLPTLLINIYFLENYHPLQGCVKRIHG